jgi:site-specific DNA recombinase
MFDRGAVLASELAASSALEKRQILARLIKRVTVHADRVEVLARFDEISCDVGESENRAAEPILLTIATRITRTGKRTALAIAPAQAVSNQRQDTPLIKLVAKAFAARTAVEAEPVDPKELAITMGQDKDYFARLVRLGYLAPDIISAILDGRQPATLTRRRLARVSKLPMDWAEQRQLLGFASV